MRREIKRGKGGGEAARFDSLESSQPPKTAKDAKIKSWLIGKDPDAGKD